MGHQLTIRQAPSHIAVIGMGCRTPGDVDSPAALWRLLLDARDAVGPPPAERAHRSPAGTGHGEAGPPLWGGYLRDVSGFDADFFGVSGKEADVLDPQHRLLLEVAWEALEHAGIAPDRLAGTATGLFAGLSYTDYMEALAGQPRELEGSILTNGHCVAAGRVSYLLGLNGPSVALDTACSSSLVALHLACQSLHSEESDLALAAGVTLLLGLRTTRSFQRMGMLSPSGRCRTFDAAADGFVRGEGCGVVVLKRLADAQRDGDRVLAVVRGSAVNQDGRSDGLAAPSLLAQQALYRHALTRAGTDPREVGMIEAHGTGTPVGDPVEFASLAEVYGVGQGRCALGSVKTNLGHLEPAAGVIGLIKAVLCLQHGLIPPNLHFTRWNQAIAAEGTRFFVPTELGSWPTRTHSRLAAVSSFGFSGTNAHVVLEQAPQAPPPRAPAVTPGPRRNTPATSPLGQATRRSARCEVFLVAAGSPGVLPAAANRLAAWLEGDGATAPLRDIAHTLALRRSPGHGRLAVVAATHHDLTLALRAFEAGRAHPGVVWGTVGAGISRRPVWVFSGHGSQWPGMGRGLLKQEPAFGAALALADTLIAAEAGFSVLDLVEAGGPVTGCARVQPVLFALQTALAATWRAHGVEPAAVVGHSMGEVAAAVVTGALSLADGVRVICRRSALLSRIAGAGAMVTVALDRAAVDDELAAHRATGSVCVAVWAAPASTVVAGTPGEVERLAALWRARGIAVHPVAVDIASHCPQVDPLLAELATALADLTPRQPALPFYSTVLEDPHRTPLFDAAYWCANLRRPVRFTSAIAAAATDRHQVYIEVSPQPVVTHAIAQSLAGLVHDPVVLPTLRRGEDESTTLRTQLAALHCSGVTVDWSTLYADANLVDVPPLTFDRRRHWVGTTTPAPRPADSPDARLPGRHTEIPGRQLRHSWSADTGTATLPWLADHRVHNSPVLPGAAYCALALAAACQSLDAAPHEVEAVDIHFRALMPLADHTAISTTTTQLAPDRADCTVFGRDHDGAWTEHATAVLHRTTALPQEPPQSPAELAAQHPVALDAAALYAGLRARGLEHGPAFTGITHLRASTRGDSFWARLTVPAVAQTPQHSLGIHPVLLDLGAQLVVAALIREPGRGLVLPVHADRVRILGDPATARYGRARITWTDADGIVGDVTLLDQDGRPVAGIDALRFVRRKAGEDSAVDRWFLQTIWQPAPHQEAAGPPDAGSWLIIGEGDGSAQRLADALSTAGAAIAVLDAPVDADPPLQLEDPLTRNKAATATAPTAVVMLCAPPTPGPDPGTAALQRTRRLLAVVQAAAARTQPPRVYAVTRAALSLDPAQAPDLPQSALRGLIRVLTHEHPDLHATLVDADPADADLAAVARELLARAPEDEVALRGSTRHIARLAYAPLSDSERTHATSCTVRYGTDRFRLRAARLGDLDALELTTAMPHPPGPGEVELRVQAAGVNFRDVLTTMGLLSTDPDAGDRIGFECAGVVTALGPGVEHLKVGDSVLAADLRGGAFASFTTVAATAVARVPAGISVTTAATLPTAYLTAWYALRHVGRLTAGERVLIHCATGGTGLAAVAVARHLGAEVLATAGSEEKRSHLRAMGIHQVMDSRTLDFSRQTRAGTGGQGVDVVLNSLSGQAIRAGLETLRPFGRFVELGVRDILADTPLGLAPLRHNITMSTVDLIELHHDRPDVFAAVMREVLAEIEHGSLAPLPCRAYPLADAGDAFRLMAAAGHIGKLVLTVPDRGETTAVQRKQPSPVQPDSAYLVTGGLRGVGLATAHWLARQGASHVVLNGRTPPSVATEQELTYLRERGTRITVVLGDIADPGTAQRLVAAATADGLPLRGVVHGAMVLDDAAITNITDDQLERVWHPKATGAWLLHQATDALALDWFVLQSSMASLLGNPGQGAYAAANAWLDAFATWRTAQGKRTLAVNWGPWGETGVATGFAARGYQTITTEDGFRALAALLAHQRVRTGVIPGDPDTWIPAAGRQSSLFSLLAQQHGEASGPTIARDIRGELTTLEPGLARRTALEHYLAEHIRTVLRLGSTTLDPQTPLTALGFDSLLRIELRTRLESGLVVKLPSDFLQRHPTLASLAAGVAAQLGLSLHTDESR
ncbi:SDR family NAD(P)-dependent oxidoreductase [Streptacidiphilus sp. EB129]|uniref:SDR family NAD(P)-dependent oxidoreductase n=1 Tax=Streptacidiphilus sp. EB129 TaxID=3156262 RepID=UPI00351325FE